MADGAPRQDVEVELQEADYTDAEIVGSAIMDHCGAFVGVIHSISSPSIGFFSTIGERVAEFPVTATLAPENERFDDQWVTGGGYEGPTGAILDLTAYVRLDSKRLLCPAQVAITDADLTSLP